MWFIALGEYAFRSHLLIWSHQHCWRRLFFSCNRFYILSLEATWVDISDKS